MGPAAGRGTDEKGWADLVNLGHANILTAFDEKAIGTRIRREYLIHFDELVIEQVTGFDFSSCRVPGQAYIVLPPDRACHMVSGGIGRRTDDPDDYVVRLHRGKVGLYLKRYVETVYWERIQACLKVKEFPRILRKPLAAPVDNVAVVVYTTEAYLNDPDITPEEAARVKEAGHTHMLVAILAASGPPSPLTPGRFVSNLAGGNREALEWTADEIRQKAREIDEYAKTWCVVAD